MTKLKSSFGMPAFCMAIMLVAATALTGCRDPGSTIVLPTFTINPAEATLTDQYPSRVITLEGTATGAVTYDRGDLPASISITPNAAANTITLAGSRPAYGAEAITGTYHVAVTRQGVTENLIVNLDLTPLPPGVLSLTPNQVVLTNENAGTDLNVTVSGGTGEVTLNNEDVDALPDEITVTTDGTTITLTGTRPVSASGNIEDEDFTVSVTQGTSTGTLTINATLTVYIPDVQLDPATITITNASPSGNSTVTGGTGEVTLNQEDRDALLPEVVLTVNDDTINVVGTPPSAQGAYRKGVYTVRVTRQGVTVSLTINVDLTSTWGEPIVFTPSVALINDDNAGTDVTVEVSGEATGTISLTQADVDALLPYITATVDGNYINIRGTRPTDRGVNVIDIFPLRVERGGYTATLNIDANLTADFTPTFGLNPSEITVTDSNDTPATGVTGVTGVTVTATGTAEGGFTFGTLPTWLGHSVAGDTITFYAIRPTTNVPPETTSVTITVTREGLTRDLTVTPNITTTWELTFGLNPTAINIGDGNTAEGTPVTVTATGTATGGFTLGNVPSWLAYSFNETTGVISFTAIRPTTNVPDITTPVTITVTREGLTKDLTVTPNITTTWIAYPVLSLSPTLVTFETLEAGYAAPPQAQTITITNTGTAEGVISNVVFGGDQTSFTWVGLETMPLTVGVAPNNTATFTVQPIIGLPARVNPYTAEVSLTYNSVPTPLSIHAAVTFTVAEQLFTIPAEQAFIDAVRNVERSVIQGLDTGVIHGSIGIGDITINGSSAHFGTQQPAGFVTSVEIAGFEFTGTNRDAAVRAAVGNLVRSVPGFAGFNDNAVNISSSTPVYLMPMSQGIFISAVRAFIGTLLPNPHDTGYVVASTFNTNNVAIGGTFYTNVGVNVNVYGIRALVHDHVLALLNETTGPHAGNPVNPHVDFPGTVTTTDMAAGQRALIIQFPPPADTGFRQPTQIDMDAFNAVNVPSVGNLGTSVSRFVPTRTGLLTHNSNILATVLRAATPGEATNLGANVLRQADTITVNFNRFLRPEYIGDIVVLQDGSRRVFMIRVGVGDRSARPMVEVPPHGTNLLNGAAWANNGDRALRLGWRPTAANITAAQRDMIIFPTGGTRVEPANIARSDAYIRIYTLFTTADGNTFAGTRVTDFDIDGNVTFDLLQRANGITNAQLPDTTIAAARVSPLQSATTHTLTGGTGQRGDGSPGRGLLLDVLTTYFWPRSTTPTTQD